MTNEEVNTALYQKMFDEQERFKEELRNASPQEIMLNAYEFVIRFVIREDILLSLEENDLADARAKALLKSDHPLRDLFLRWENHESHHMEEILDVIECHADEIIRDTKTKANRDTR